MNQKYCRNCSDKTLVLGQVDYSQPSQKVTFRKSGKEMGMVMYYNSVHNHDLCYYCSKFSDTGRRLVDGVPNFYKLIERIRKSRLLIS